MATKLIEHPPQANISQYTSNSSKLCQLHSGTSMKSTSANIPATNEIMEDSVCPAPTTEEKRACLLSVLLNT